MESQAVNDALAKLEALDAAPELENEGELCEFHSYDAFKNKRGELTVLQSGHRDHMGIDTERSADAALVLTRYYDVDKELTDTVLEIKSPYIKAAMRKVIRSYPGVNIMGTRNILLSDQPRCLFHYRNELRDYAIRSSDGHVIEHLSMCMTYMTRRFQKEIVAFNTLMKANPEKAGLEFDYLWMAFRPGMLLYSNEDGTEKIFKLVDMRKARLRYFLPGSPGRECWELELLRVSSDGNSIGHVEVTLHINPYDGYKPLRELNCYPLQHHQDQAGVKRDLIARGRKYVSLLGIQFRLYKCPKNDPSKPWRERPDRKLDNGEPLAETIDLTHVLHRVIVDCNYYYKEKRIRLGFYTEERTIPITTNETPSLREEELLLCSHLLPGFSLLTKKWDFFDITMLDAVPFNADAFNDLVLPAEKKKVIELLVKMEGDTSNVCNDLITGKGKGIVFLLHGPPGVGKTLTAEGIADHTRRPLYTINCSDLSQNPRIVEQTLEETLALAKRWNAITLIDEADVFMAERTITNLRRNELVSVLLRQLESFEGVMFLTTNRVEAIDDAFMSRVHLSITYPPLSPASRSKIWRVFARQNLPAAEMSQWLERGFLAELSRANVNGRQIKNAVRVAQAIAASEKRSMSPKDVRSVLEMLASFNDDLEQRASKKRQREADEVEIATSSKRSRIADLEDDYDGDDYNDNNDDHGASKDDNTGDSDLDRIDDADDDEDDDGEADEQ